MDYEESLARLEVVYDDRYGKIKTDEFKTVNDAMEYFVGLQADGYKPALYVLKRIPIPVRL